MKKSIYLYFVFLPFLFLNCFGQTQKDTSSKEERILSNNTSTKKTNNATGVTPLSFNPYLKTEKPNTEKLVAEYLRDIHEDKKGNIWFGTLARGVARFDGKSLTYFSIDEGLADTQVNEIAEDKKGNLWFATTNGVSKYDGNTFTNFRTSEGLQDNGTWSIMIDSKDNIWVGTMKGVSVFRGSKFEEFPLPKADIDELTFRFDPKLAWSIIEDREGNIWFGTDGQGAWRYHPNNNTFTNFTKKDGLCNNVVYHVLEDQNGAIWFGAMQTRVAEKDNPYSYVDSSDGGLSRYQKDETEKGFSVDQFPNIKGLNGTNICPIYEDNDGNIWIASMHYGAYKFDGKEFKLFSESFGLTNNCIQSILHDRKGRYWFGFSGGLFWLQDNNFFPITKEGPWPISE
ncbi:MAG: two-component regulator propeller domain-containing protein [Saprospiraceae bacterium]